MLVLQQPGLFSLSAAFLSLSLFYLLYEWWYGKETFWQVNRLYLLLAPALAFVIPHLRIVVAPEVVAPGTIDPELLLLLQQWQAGNVLPSPQTGPRLGEMVLAAYLSGVLIALLRLFLRSYRVISLIRNGTRRERGDCTLVLHEEFQEPASFFHYIFSPSVQALPEMILQHELVHVRQRHTLDVLLMECWVALHWYNPLIYRFRNRLRVTHEFIADAAVVRQQDHGAYAYARLLIAQPLNQSDMLYNTFAAQISTRLRMLARRPSASWRLAAHSLSLPLVMALFLFFSVQIAKSSPIATLEQQMALIEAREVSISSMPQTSVPPVLKDTENTAPADTLPKKEKVIVVVGHPLNKDTLNGQRLKMDTIQFESASTPRNTMTEALFVIDGVIQNRPSQEALELVKPEDIQSINVLKGPGATALYGEQGKNGVVEITTKKGNPSGNNAPKDSRTITMSGTPGKAGETQTINMNVEIRDGGSPGKAKSRTTVRILSNGDFVGEVKNLRNAVNYTADQVIIQEEIEQVRMKDLDNTKMNGKKGNSPAEIRTITLDISNRQQAEEMLNSLRKGKKW
jgi:TonB-dependent SusC/RagA subfamily outer membrane receptor